jgi:hypothetical protein
MDTKTYIKIISAFLIQTEGITIDDIVGHTLDTEQHLFKLKNGNYLIIEEYDRNGLYSQCSVNFLIGSLTDLEAINFNGRERVRKGVYSYNLYFPKDKDVNQEKDLSLSLLPLLTERVDELLKLSQQKHAADFIKLLN